MFGKFMNKKFFHPGSYPNVKMRWIHEQRDAAKKKNEEEKKCTYQKEQESYQSRMLSAKTTEEKMKLDLNFLYDLPPGMKVDEDKEEEDKEKDCKFEWQKNAPRSKYIGDLGLDCADQPFGVCVRNIRCFKCKAWGHQNTDRECPLYFTNVGTEADGSAGSSSKGSLRLSDPLLLVDSLKKQHGLTLKKSVIGQEIDPMAENQQLVESDEDGDELGKADLMFVESLTDKQKRKLLKRLNKLEKKENKKIKKERKKEKDLYKNEAIDNYNSSSDDDVRSYKRRKIQKEYRKNNECKNNNEQESSNDNIKSYKGNKGDRNESDEDRNKTQKNSKRRDCDARGKRHKNGSSNSGSDSENDLKSCKKQNTTTSIMHGRSKHDKIYKAYTSQKSNDSNNSNTHNGTVSDSNSQNIEQKKRHKDMDNKSLRSRGSCKNESSVKISSRDSRCESFDGIDEQIQQIRSDIRNAKIRRVTK